MEIQVLSEIDASVYLAPLPAFAECKGAFTENLLFQSFIANGINARSDWVFS